jgi:predicted RND superfamily exporter protein
MYESTPEVLEIETTVSGTPKAMLAMAVVAPFGVIALMASPLVFDALRHAVGM